MASDPQLDPDLEALLDQNDPDVVGPAPAAGAAELDPDLEALLDANDPEKAASPRGAWLRGRRPSDPQSSFNRASDESSAAGLTYDRDSARLLAEVGIPLAAGALFPPAGPAARGVMTGGSGLARLAPAAQELIARTGLMGLASAMGAEAGNIVDPPASEEEAASRRNSAAAAGVLGETAIPGGLGMAGGLVKPFLRFADRNAAKAGGFTLSSLNRAGREEAQRVGGVMRREGVIGRIPRSPEVLLERANALKDQYGRELSQIRELVDQAAPGASVDDMLEEIRSRLGGEQATLRDIVPGTSTEDALLRQLSAAEGDVRSFARQGARDAPVVGPEGDRAFWEMTRPQVIEGASYAPAVGPNQSHMYEELRRHEDAIREALHAGQPVPAQVLRDYPELAERIYPDFANASTLAAIKKHAGDLAYEYSGQAGRSPETLGGMIAPRWEDVRGVAQGAEEALVAGARPDLFGEFMRGKDVYGAMERLTNKGTGVMEAAANRELGNNQVFSMTGQLAHLASRAAGDDPIKSTAFAAFVNWLARRGNQLSSKYIGEDGARLFGTLEAASPLGRYLAQVGNQGLGLATEEPPPR